MWIFRDFSDATPFPMADFLTKPQRSERMSRIRGKGNKTTELRLMAVFKAHRITGWRRGAKLVGRPDFVFPKLRLAVFVDGCFWHGCPRHGNKPTSNVLFWQRKIARNRQRDRQVNRMLKGKDWHVLRVWEHELAKKRQPKLVNRVRSFLAPPEKAPGF